MYENRICSFIDILGFSNLISKTNNNDSLQLKIINCLDIISNSSKLLNDPNLSHVVRPVLEKNAGRDIPEIIPEKSSLTLRSTSFSDCLVISSELSFKGWLNHTLTLILLTHNLLDLGILIRGGTTVGDLYQKDNIVFGNAMIDAYKIENEVSNYPRISISQKAIESIITFEPIKGTLLNFYAEDFDGITFLDFLEEPCLEIACLNDKNQEWVNSRSNGRLATRINKTSDNIHKILKGNQFSSYKIKMKMKWLAVYLNKSLSTKEYFLPEFVDEPTILI